MQRRAVIQAHGKMQVLALPSGVLYGAPRPCVWGHALRCTDHLESVSQPRPSILVHSCRRFIWSPTRTITSEQRPRALNLCSTRAHSVSRSCDANADLLVPAVYRGPRACGRFQRGSSPSRPLPHRARRCKQVHWPYPRKLPRNRQLSYSKIPSPKPSAVLSS